MCKFNWLKVFTMATPLLPEGAACTSCMFLRKINYTNENLAHVDGYFIHLSFHLSKCLQKYFRVAKKIKIKGMERRKQNNHLFG